MNCVKVDNKGLQKVLQNIGNCKFVSITADTVPSLKSPKTNNLLKPNGDSRIIKRSKVVISTGDSLDYKSVVNRRLVKVGEQPIIEVQPRKWGERVPNTPFVINCGKLYLEALVNKVVSTQYFFDGNEVTKDDIKEYLREKTNADTYALGENQPIWRDYNLENIREVVADGVIYIVKE